MQIISLTLIQTELRRTSSYQAEMEGAPGCLHPSVQLTELWTSINHLSL